MARERSTSKSSVSRAFVQRTREALWHLMSRQLADLRLAVVMLDGIEIKGRTNIVALGITTEGDKLALGLWSGSTENATIASALHAFSCLAARGGRLHRPNDAQAERREADVRRRAAAFVGHPAAGSPRRQQSRRAQRNTGSPRLSGSHAARGRRHPPRDCYLSRLVRQGARGIWWSLGVRAVRGCVGAGEGHVVSADAQAYFGTRLGLASSRRHDV